MLNFYILLTDLSNRLQRNVSVSLISSCYPFIIIMLDKGFSRYCITLNFTIIISSFSHEILSLLLFHC